MGDKTLMKYLRDNAARGIIDYRLRCQMEGEVVTFYIHPQDKDGDTQDFQVLGNQLSPRFPEGEGADGADSTC